MWCTTLRGRVTPRIATKRHGRGVSGASPHSLCRPLRSGCGAGPPSHPLRPGKRGADGGSVNGKATAFLHDSPGCRRITSPTSGDRDPPWRRCSSGSDALPPWYAVASSSPSRHGTGYLIPRPALSTVTSSGRCRGTVPQTSRHGKKKMRPLSSFFVAGTPTSYPSDQPPVPAVSIPYFPYNMGFAPASRLDKCSALSVGSPWPPTVDVSL